MQQINYNGTLPEGATLVVTDTNVERLIIEPLGLYKGVARVALEPGDANKTVEQAGRVWTALQQAGATRRSLVVNFGGGMVTDLGGFAAATFKRGVPFVNVPTTLLAAIDAAVGGKTGVNFRGLKNEVGVFREADSVVITPRWLATLPVTELLSGWGEMLKHALIDSLKMLAQALTQAGEVPDEALLRANVEVKRRVVEADPYEKGIRRILNVGHTVGHAVEELALERGEPVPHGYAVAWGLVAETVLSHLEAGFPSDTLHQLAAVVRRLYGPMPVGCKDYDELLRLMGGDKKNTRAGEPAFSLLRAPGEPLPELSVPGAEKIKTALDIARDLL